MARAELEQPLAIVGARLVDGTGRDAMLASCVRIEPDGRIAAVESLGETSISKGVAVVDAAGMTLLPGLIDGHQHVMWDKSLYATRSLGEQNDCLEDTEQQLVRAGYHVQMALAAGVVAAVVVATTSWGITGMEQARGTDARFLEAAGTDDVIDLLRERGVDIATTDLAGTQITYATAGEVRASSFAVPRFAELECLMSVEEPSTGKSGGCSSRQRSMRCGQRS